jgi:DNA polymerase alpha subunit A
MILPLTKQLTELCGNLWARSLQAQRAERNEYLLLHKFHSLKYICPDKLTAQERKEAADAKRGAAKAATKAAASKKRKASATSSSSSSSSAAAAAAGGGGADDMDESAANGDVADESMTAATAAAVPLEDEDEEDMGVDDDDDDDATNSRGRRKKPAYSGGLVLEPKKGFYDKFVILLDFNSLYPSIIQEFNLCFTTLEHWRVNEAGLPELPSALAARPGATAASTGAFAL